MDRIFALVSRIRAVFVGWMGLLLVSFVFLFVFGFTLSDQETL